MVSKRPFRAQLIIGVFFWADTDDRVTISDSRTLIKWRTWGVHDPLRVIDPDLVPNERRTLREDQRKGNAALEPHLIQEIVSTVVFT